MSQITADPVAQLTPPAAKLHRSSTVLGGRRHGSSARLGTWEKSGWILMAVLMVLGLPMAFQRAIDSGPDLAGFCDAGRYILQHGTRDPESTLSRYWPSADVPWILFAWLPISVIAVVWYCLNCATWLALLHTIGYRLLGGLTSDTPTRSVSEVRQPSPRLRFGLVFDPIPIPYRHATLAAGLLAMPLVLDGMALGSFHILMLWLMILGLDRACRGQTASGGILLGIAAWLKLLPLLGVGFLVYHRKWKAAAVAVATVVFLEISLSVLAFGPAGAWREHVTWWQQGAQGTADRQLTSQSPCDEDRLTNQSVAITLRRLLTSLGIAQTNGAPSAMPATAKVDPPAPWGPLPASAYDQARRRVQFADLSPAQLRVVFLAVLGLLAAGMAVYCWPNTNPKRKRGDEPGDDRANGLSSPLASWTGATRHSVQSQLIMLSLATLWFSPVTWSYHFVAAVPAVASLLLRARYRWIWIGPVLLVWCGAHCLLAFCACRAAGVLLWMSLLLGAGLLIYPTYSPRKA